MKTEDIISSCHCNNWDNKTEKGLRERICFLAENVLKLEQQISNKERDMRICEECSKKVEASP